MKRHIFSELQKWKVEPDRKVLLLRGARQVGKTYLIRELGKTFDQYLEVNFDEHPKVKTFFEASLDPLEIIEKLGGFFGKSIIPGKTLLFFDEIQACPNAIRSLHFGTFMKNSLNCIPLRQVRFWNLQSPKSRHSGSDEYIRFICSR